MNTESHSGLNQIKAQNKRPEQKLPKDENKAQKKQNEDDTRYRRVYLVFYELGSPWRSGQRRGDWHVCRRVTVDRAV
jgi:hypothetical protein